MVAVGASPPRSRGSTGHAHTRRKIPPYFLFCAAAAVALVNVVLLTRLASSSASGGRRTGTDGPSYASRRKYASGGDPGAVTPEMMYNSRLRLEYQCLSKASEMRDLISGTEQVIILMPAKAAGTSLKDFAKACNGRSYSRLGDNFINFDFEHIVSNSFRMPPVITSHIYHVDNLIYMIENTPRNTLIVYVHREETERLLSAINEVVTNYCRRGNGHPGIIIEPPDGFFYKEERHNCYVTEDTLVDVAIKEKAMEIGLGASELLPCETFEAIKTNAPHLVFADYTNGNQLQQLVAEKYCPHLADDPVESNVGSDKEYEAHVRLRNSEMVPLGSWLKAKRSTLEWALGLNRQATCRAKARLMEDGLVLCKSGFLNTAVTED